MLAKLRLPPRRKRRMPPYLRHGLGVALMTLTLHAGAATISGTATCPDRSTLPPDATLEVTVEDVSLADAAATVIGRIVRMPAGQVPIRFEVPYVETAVQPNHRYALRARITVNGQLRCISTVHTPVLTMGGGTDGIALQLQRVGAPEAARADAIQKPDRTIVNTYWKLVQLRGAPVVIVPQQREPHVILQLGTQRIIGSGGCSRLAGTYTLHGDFVTFADVTATEKACASGMEQEAEFGAALARVKSWRVRGDELALLDDANATILSFVAVDLR
jgi:putative lipoprotein